MKIEQISFLEPIEKAIKKHEIYDGAICNRCCCNKCKYSVEIYPFLSVEECKEVKDGSCLNCDECYYYGMDNESLSRNIIKFNCNKFKISNYYSELEAKTKRRNFKIM